jgi:hypothetical protein
MSITDELREFKGHINAGLAPDMVLALRAKINCIADRIDDEHERITHNLTDALHKQEDATRELDEKSVLLPVDADGKLIDAGHETTYGKVDYIKNSSRGWEVVISEGPCAGTYHPSVLHHTPTVEDVLREFTHAILNQKACYREQNIAEYAAKLRLASETE